MRWLTYLLGLLMLGGIVLAAAAFVPSPPSVTLFDLKSIAFDRPAGATLSDEVGFASNFAFGTSEPTTLVAGDPQGKVTAVATGFRLSNGDHQVVITLQDESNDMMEAQVFVNGVLKKTATRANGGIIDSDGQAIATMAIYLNLVSFSTVDTYWTDTTGYQRFFAITQL